MKLEDPTPPPSELETSTEIWASPSKPLIVRVGNELLVYTDLGNTKPLPQCVAKAKRGRCSQPIGGRSDYDGWSEWRVGVGRVVEAMEPGLPDDAYIRQRCQAHLKTDAPDAVAPSWEMFDPVKHARSTTGPSAPAWTPDGLEIGHGDLISDGRRDEGRDLAALLKDAEENRVDPPLLTVLYRYYDDQDQLLYVGITDNLLARTESHIDASSWMDFAARSTIERYPTRKEAERVEREAIRAEKPLFNSQHNATPEAQKRLVEYLIEHGRTDLLVAAVSRG